MQSIDFSRENVRAAGLDDRIHLEHGDVTQLRFPDSAFERVLCALGVAPAPASSAG